MVEQTSLANNKPCGHVVSAKGVRGGRHDETKEC